MLFVCKKFGQPHSSFAPEKKCHGTNLRIFSLFIKIEIYIFFHRESAENGEST